MPGTAEHYGHREIQNVSCPVLSELGTSIVENTRGNTPTIRLGGELIKKLTNFQKSFDRLLQAQADAMQMEHAPSQSVAEHDFFSLHTPKFMSFSIQNM